MKNLFSLIICLFMTSCVANLYGQSNKKVQAPVAQSVIIGETGSSNAIGYFEEVTNDVWRSNINGQITMYTEAGRDQWTVSLKALDTDQYVALNLWTQQVLYTGVQKYAVLESRSDAVPDKYLTSETTPPVVTTPTVEPGKITNVALGKSARQSSILSNADGYSARHANDGVPQTLGGGTIMCTNSENQPWWEVDLQGTFDISKITLHNRTNCCPDRLDKFTILVSNSPFTGNSGGTTFTSNQAAPKGTKTYSGNAKGRYVRIFLNQKNYLSIPEIEIFGMSGVTTPTKTITPPVVTPVDNSGTNNTQITDYIRGLNYNAQDLLAIKPDGAKTTFKPGSEKERKPYGNKVIVCTKTKRRADAKLDKVSILNPTAGVIFPGALILGDRKLADGLPTPITFERAPIVLSVDLPGMTKGVTVQNPVHSEVQNGINSMLNTWNIDNGTSENKTAGKIFKDYQKAYSSEQLAIDLGFNVKWAQGEASAQTKFEGSSEQEVTVAFFKQVYYTVTMDYPTRPSDVFDASKVTRADVASRFDNQKPPAYVRSVDYGRLVMVRMETNNKALAIELEGALEVALNPTTALEADLKSKYEGIWKNSKFTVYIMGGNAQAGAEFAAGSDLSGLPALITSGATYSPKNPGVPIAYTVAWLKDNEHAGIRISTDYTETECVEYDDAMIKLVHAGAYVARIKLTWQEPNAQGTMVTKEKDYGKQTAGWTVTHKFAGDVQDIRVSAEAATGLVWAPWGEIMNEHLTGPTNCTYRFHGTTLDRKFDVTCPDN